MTQLTISAKQPIANVAASAALGAIIDSTVRPSAFAGLVFTLTVDLASVGTGLRRTSFLAE